MSEKVLILLVDDEPMVLELVETRLKHQGYEVATALNGELAYQYLTQHKPHLIICDVVMPVMDGPTFCRKIRAEGNTTPFLFLTARGLPQDMIEILSAGGDDYIVKPFDAKEFLARIKAVLRRHYPDAA